MTTSKDRSDFTRLEDGHIAHGLGDLHGLGPYELAFAERPDQVAFAMLVRNARVTHILNLCLRRSVFGYIACSHSACSC